MFSTEDALRPVSKFYLLGFKCQFTLDHINGLALIMRTAKEIIYCNREAQLHEVGINDNKWIRIRPLKTHPYDTKTLAQSTEINTADFFAILCCLSFVQQKLCSSAVTGRRAFKVL